MNDSDSWFERGHVAIVTGASKGLGFEVARSLLERGIAVVIAARRANELRVAADFLCEFGTVEAIAGDVADPEFPASLVRAASEHFGRLDLVINNASTIGETSLSRLDAISTKALASIYETNVFGPLRLMQAALPHLLRSGGTIVNVTSDAAIEAYPTWGGYGSSKAALEHLSRTLAAEYAGFPLSIVVADPGNMNTELHEFAEPGEDLSALARAADVAPALMRLLAGPRESFVRATLQTLAVPA